MRSATWLGDRARALCTALALLLASSRAAEAQSAPAPGVDSPEDLVGFGDAPPASSERAAPESSAAGEDEVGFGTSGPRASEPSAPSEATSAGVDAEPSPWTFVGVSRLLSAMRLEQGGARRLAKLRESLGARLEYKHAFRGALAIEAVASGRAESDLALLMHRDAYDAPTRELYEWQLLPWESYLKLRAGPFELAVGEQIVNQGQGEVLSIFDVVNPRDLREPLLGELDELRMPVLMTRARLALGDFGVQAIAVHEPYFGLVPPPLGEFSPFRKLLLSDPSIGDAFASRVLRNQHIPGRDLRAADATQFHGRVDWSGPGVDIALHASSLLDGLGVPGLPEARAFSSQSIHMPIFHPRYTLVGTSGAWSVGAFVLRWELAGELNRPLSTTPTDSAFLRLSWLRRTMLRGMLGLTYVPSLATNLALELLQGYVIDNPERTRGSGTNLLLPVEATQLALRINHRFLQDRAYVSGVLLLIGLAEFNACVARVELGGSPMQDVEVAVGATVFQPSERFGLFYGFERNDRAFLNVRWYFTGK